jgi:hypothetical protein
MIVESAPANTRLVISVHNGKVDVTQITKCKWGECMNPVYKDGVCWFAWLALNYTNGVKK